MHGPFRLEYLVPAESKWKSKAKHYTVFHIDETIFKPTYKINLKKNVENQTRPLKRSHLVGNTRATPG